ncbi:orotate phosphoribosyltransferase [Calderihabitans maritimus]|uniref:Orotate phosphoribosyltransferase n=1 Tax=Calderihabitans maritimus TaxID=1246530 RepID=A0A1Z5HWL8_9FIRM|nr:orotate phosphoribosyltransferase [Calderihabitans maritimus]GAW93929.1 orotate phosphoribosyltransferase [Calderihabitans maritimus]
MLSQEEILNMFTSCEALLEGHFLLSSGLHSNRYIQCAKVLQYPEYATKLARELAERFLGKGIKAVVGPALGGIIVAHEVARWLNARALFTERQDNFMTLRRGFSIGQGEKVLVVEDVITTGGSVQEVIEVVQKSGGKVEGVGVLVDRSGGHVRLDYPVESLLSLTVETFSAEECPLCRAGIPLVKPGSRKV